MVDHWSLHIAPAHSRVGEGARLLRQKQIIWLRTTCGRNTTERRKPLKSVLRGCRASVLSYITYLHARHVLCITRMPSWGWGLFLDHPGVQQTLLQRVEVTIFYMSLAPIHWMTCSTNVLCYGWCTVLVFLSLTAHSVPYDLILAIKSLFSFSHKMTPIKWYKSLYFMIENRLLKKQDTY